MRNDELEGFEDEELIEELEWRGYHVNGNALCDILSNDLIDELKDRGYNVPIDNKLANMVYWQIRDGANVTDEMRNLIAGLTGRIL